jgi:hypothetical protein
MFWLGKRATRSRGWGRAMSEYEDEDFDLERRTLEEDLLDEGWGEAEDETLGGDLDEFEIDHSDEDL